MRSTVIPKAAVAAFGIWAATVDQGGAATMREFAHAQLHGTAIAHARSWISPRAKSATDLLYVADGAQATVDIFSVAGSQITLVGQIANLNAPEGMTTDAAGNLYVVNDFVPSEGPTGGELLVFPKGQTQPSRTINPNPWDPIDVAVDKRGTIYLANIDPIGQFSPGSVSVYGKSDTKPLRVLKDAAFQEIVGIAVDPATRDAYVSYQSQSGNGGLAVFRRGRGKAADLGVSYGPPWGLLRDGNGNLLVCDGNGPIDIYAQTGGPLLGTIAVPGTAEFEAFNSDRSLLYVTNFYNFDVEIFSYPSGTMVGSVKQSSWGKNAWPTGVAYWPPPTS